MRTLVITITESNDEARFQVQDVDLLTGAATDATHQYEVVMAEMDGRTGWALLPKDEDGQ